MSAYQIKSGDTLSAIARTQGTSVRALLQANPQVANPDLIMVGGHLEVPLAPVSDPAVADAVDLGTQADAEANRTEEATSTGPCNCKDDEETKNPAETPVDAEANEDLLAPVAPDPMDETDFGKSFETTTGTKLSETIAQYEADTGKELSPDTVETLFTDHDAARTLLMNDRTLHQNYRDILNQNIPATAQAAEAAGYERLSYIKSWYHDPWNNSKWISPDGHLEAVYNKTTGALDNSDAYKGTFNFFGPDNFGGHKAADVDPYNKWGN